jgi:nucleoside-diphosphate-sugar epimerase
MLFLAIFISSVVISLLLSSLLRCYASARSLLDTPNKCNSHTVPTPRDVADCLVEASTCHSETPYGKSGQAAGKIEAIGQTYLVTDGQPYSTRELYEWIFQVLGKPVPAWRIPEVVLRVLAKIGDAIGALRGRRFMFDSDTLEKLAGSAWYSSQKIEQEQGFRAKYHLQDSLPDIIKSLRDDSSHKLNNVL